MRRFLIGAGACLLLAACVPQSQYYWGNYSQALYNYYGNPTKVQDYHQALVEVIAEAGPQNRVPPGLYAELGYLELQAGNESGAKDNFLKEKALWPESAAYMDRMIAAIDMPDKGKESTVQPATPSESVPAKAGS
jgi:hypothetical protein